MVSRVGEWMLPAPVALGVLVAWLPLTVPVMAGLTCGLVSYAVLSAAVGQTEPATPAPS